MIAIANRLYGWLLLAYPPVYRREYATEMSLTFRNMNCDARQRGGIAALIVLWIRTLLDYGDSLLTAYAEALRERNLGLRINALIVALIVPGTLLWVAAFLDLVMGSPWLFDHIFRATDSAIPDNIFYPIITFLMPGIAFLLSLVLWKRSRMDSQRAILPYVVLGVSVFIAIATTKFLIGENLIPYLQETF